MGISPYSLKRNNMTTAQDTLAELERLGSTQGGGGLNLKVVETCDHRSIFLYTHLNKRIGRLHPRNAETTVRRFEKAGIQLFLHPRTPEQIEEYKTTDLYKKLHKKHVDTRALRRKQSKGKELENMAKVIASEVGGAVADAMSKDKTTKAKVKSKAKSDDS